MEAAEVIPGQPARVLASDREVTRLGESVFRNGSVSEEALKATCAVLARMADALPQARRGGRAGGGHQRDSRHAQSGASFWRARRRRSGTQVEIISGREEARLIHLGVESVWPQRDKRILIIDIGGGSAEIIAADGGTCAKRIPGRWARSADARNFLRTIRRGGRTAPDARVHPGKARPPCGVSGRTRWDRVIATSATASAVAAAVAGRRAPTRGDRPASRHHRAGPQTLRHACRTQAGGAAEDHRIGPRRAEIIVPGVAVLLAVSAGVSLAGVLLLAGRRARRHHRRSGGAKCGRGTVRG